MLTALAVDARGVALDLQIHVAQPIAPGPAPVTLLVIDIFSRDILEQVAGIETVGSLQADQGLVQITRILMALALADRKSVV